MLVSPSGLSVLLMSDAGSSFDVTNLVLNFDDSAGDTLSDNSLITSGTYRVSSFQADAQLAAPAPQICIATNLAALNGSLANGTWSLYVTDDAVGDFGAITNGWVLTLQTAATPPPNVIISEFRLRGPNGANDEFIELYNNSDCPITVSSVDTSAGWSVAAANGIRFVITNGTILPPRGHFLGVNSVGYGIGSYPAGNDTTATGNCIYATDIADNAGIALFRSAISTNLNLATRLDAFGSSSEANTLYKEGTGYPALTPSSA